MRLGARPAITRALPLVQIPFRGPKRLVATVSRSSLWMTSTDSLFQGTAGGTTASLVLKRTTRLTARLTLGQVCRVNLLPRLFVKTKIQRSAGSTAASITRKTASTFFNNGERREQMRQCIECLKTRDFIAFYKNPHKSGGYEPRCKVCYKKTIRKAAKTLKREEKCCSSCKVTKPISEFYKANSSRDGHGAYCKPCVADKARIYRKSNPKVRIRENLSSKLYRENEDPEKRRKRKREYYAKNRERILRQRKEKEIREAMQKMSSNA